MEFMKEVHAIVEELKRKALDMRRGSLDELRRRDGLVDDGQMVDLAVFRSVMEDYASRLEDAVAEVRPLSDARADELLRAELDRVIHGFRVRMEAALVGLEALAVRVH